MIRARCSGLSRANLDSGSGLPERTLRHPAGLVRYVRFSSEFATETIRYERQTVYAGVVYRYGD